MFEQILSLRVSRVDGAFKARLTMLLRRVSNTIIQHGHAFCPHDFLTVPHQS